MSDGWIDNYCELGMAESEPSRPQAVSSSLSFKHLFNHFFLLHDFFHKITKTKGNNADYFDLQIDIYNGMKAAVTTGSKGTQIIAFTSLCWYFIRGNSIRLRFLYGFLFMYWYNHIMTLGSYAGVYLRMPSIYKKTLKYYQLHPEQPNMIVRLNEIMDRNDGVEEPAVLLNEIFGVKDEEKSYVANEFFVKNKEKYLPKEVLEYNIHNELKLKYLDSFISRYVYYSFTRWMQRMGQFLSFESNDD